MYNIVYIWGGGAMATCPASESLHFIGETDAGHTPITTEPPSLQSLQSLYDYSVIKDSCNLVANPVKTLETVKTNSFKL